MTHVRTTLLAPAASAAGAPEPDPDAMADRRRLADTLEMSGGCPHEPCRRARRCRGPRGFTAAFPGKALPACLAGVFDEMYAPVARWAELWVMVAEAEARLAEFESRRDPSRPTSPGPPGRDRARLRPGTA